MRPLHLVGLRGAGDRELIFHPEGHVPLVLTSLVPAMDQEQILGFYQQILVPEGQLPRIEVEWGQSLLPTDRAFLRAMRERHGAQQALVVVRVLRDQPNVDLQQILLQPEIDAFQHVAISALDPMENESLVRLAELGRFVADIAQERYEEIANELGLRPEAFNSIQHRVRMLLNPVDILEAVNALIDVQDEAKAIDLAAPVISGARSTSEASLTGAAGTVEDQVVWRILSRMLDTRPAEEQVLLAALALDKRAELSKIKDFHPEKINARLRSAQLIRNGELSNWASWLKEPKQQDLLRNLIARASARRRGEIRLLGHARSWFRDHRERKSGNDIHTRILAAFGLINGGKYGRAEEELGTIRPELDLASTSDEIRGDFWDAYGRLAFSTGRADEGIEAIKRAVTLLEKGQANPTSRAMTVDALARGLRKLGLWSEAEPLFRQAIQLAEQGGATPDARATLIDEYARGLRDAQRWPEAEPLFREAVRLKEEAGDTPTSRAITITGLAMGLRDNGRWPEADPLFRQALRLKEEGGDTLAGRAITMHEFACGLRDNNGWPEAEPLFRQALRAKEEGGGTPTSRGTTMHELACGLRDNSRWPEAEPLFREALRLAEEGGDTRTSRAITMAELARGLRDNGRTAEASALEEDAVRLMKATS